MNRSNSELSDLSDDDETHEPRILEGESSSGESNEEKHGNICNGKIILDQPLPSMSLQPIYLIVSVPVNSWIQYKQDTISNKIPPKNHNGSLKILS
ncbi:hypothetical protein TNCV_1949461 [Trichonephila clavipes]|nr:hypothetical protein TNCV_1949461 [Trichonephila clavipes]